MDAFSSDGRSFVPGPQLALFRYDLYTSRRAISFPLSRVTDLLRKLLWSTQGHTP